MLFVDLLDKNTFYRDYTVTLQVLKSILQYKQLYTCNKYFV